MSLPMIGDLAVVTLASGSRGNCTWIGDARQGVLIDCGLSARQVLARLDAVGLGDAPIDAVLLTHEHADHVGAAAILERRLAARGRPAPFYATRGTAAGLDDRCRPQRLTTVAAGAPVRLGGWTLEPHAIPHDTAEPVAWTVDTGRLRAGVITDLGHAPRLVEVLLASLDLAVVEFNHDVELLLGGSYPWALKQRIRGRHGHLSNHDAAGLVRRGASARLRHLILGHLSEENNRPELALDAAARALRDAGRREVQVHVGSQERPIGPAVATPGRSTEAAQLTLWG
ncbi:MAG TPA: MBL fold metallo-hydrolase [Myxococcota bacterium]|nr:MBL fold metallo-hydrolase [Myxococcota bacterium]